MQQPFKYYDLIDVFLSLFYLQFTLSKTPIRHPSKEGRKLYTLLSEGQSVLISRVSDTSPRTYIPCTYTHAPCMYMKWSLVYAGECSANSSSVIGIHSS